MRRELGALIKSGKILGVRSFYSSVVSHFNRSDISTAASGTLRPHEKGPLHCLTCCTSVLLASLLPALSGLALTRLLSRPASRFQRPILAAALGDVAAVNPCEAAVSAASRSLVLRFKPLLNHVYKFILCSFRFSRKRSLHFYFKKNQAFVGWSSALVKWRKRKELHSALDGV